MPRVAQLKIPQVVFRESETAKLGAQRVLVEAFLGPIGSQVGITGLCKFVRVVSAKRSCSCLAAIMCQKSR